MTSCTVTTDIIMFMLIGSIFLSTRQNGIFRCKNTTSYICVCISVAKNLAKIFLTVALVHYLFSEIIIASICQRELRYSSCVRMPMGWQRVLYTCISVFARPTTQGTEHSLVHVGYEVQLVICFIAIVIPHNRLEHILLSSSFLLLFFLLLLSLLLSLCNLSNY